MTQRFLVCTLTLAALFVQVLATAPTAAQDGKWELDPRVLHTIAPEPQTDETFSGPLTLPISTAPWKPKTLPVTETLAEMQKRIVLRRGIWNLEFSFKPLRMMTIQVPTDRGLEPRLIWYMVYRIRYLGNDLMPTAQETRFGGKSFPNIVKVNSGPHRFFPRFVLEETQEVKKSYMDRVIPAAMEPIFRREFKANRTENLEGKLYDSVSISSVPIQLSTENDDNPVWGVVTWDNIDPRVDYFSIYVHGLSNAFQMKIEANGQPGKLSHKTLKLNFYRPGDSLEETEDEIKYGIPVVADPREQLEMTQRYGQQKRLDHLWLYQ